MSDSDQAEDSDYTPIPCGLYSGYEVAILHRQTLSLQWRDDKGLEHVERVVPILFFLEEQAERMRRVI